MPGSIAKIAGPAAFLSFLIAGVAAGLSGKYYFQCYVFMIFKFIILFKIIDDKSNIMFIK